MIIAFWCVLVAGLLPIFCSYLAKFGSKAGADGTPRFDNHEPRAWLALQTGMRGRANAAQANSWEAFPFFAAGVVVAVLQHVPVATINLLAILFIVARVAFIACYVADRPMLRSPAWSVGFSASIALFAVAATGSLR